MTALRVVHRKQSFRVNPFTETEFQVVGFQGNAVSCFHIAPRVPNSELRDEVAMSGQVLVKSNH